MVRKEEGFTHVLLSTQTTENNALTPEVKYTHTNISACEPHTVYGFVFYIHLFYFTIRGFASVSGRYLQEHGL